MTWRSKKYREQFQFWPCVVCTAPSSEAAHVRIGQQGIGMKPADSCCVPLCSYCHRTGPDAQHRHNEREWWEARGVNPLVLSRRLHTFWLDNPGRPDAQSVFETLNAAHTAIETHAWKACKQAGGDFAANPTPERAAIRASRQKRAA